MRGGEQVREVLGAECMALQAGGTQMEDSSGGVRVCVWRGR